MTHSDAAVHPAVIHALHKPAQHSCHVVGRAGQSGSCRLYSWCCCRSQALSSLGPFVESNAGHARFLSIYAVSAIAGSLASYWFCPSMSVGASGMSYEVSLATCTSINLLMRPA
jgi:Rhomboid family